ncbi:unknown [Crocosphaera subtropica ATCC 51142]|uniref:Sulfotransferase domain-containing protein n=1 Tax=Crocosphaera subtropica (strain ATCC 51142 / BH68) TaxID=43989 RepID=B1WU20_CROS5|nr:hypothetical protein [Crocosphaera subtropica]ACB52082.1 unknown [Crocosphaera subtropica ATCC 51142]
MEELPEKIVKKLKEVPNAVKRLIYQQKILNHRLIFSINSGRTGSGYLAKLLGTAEEVTGYHEKQPAIIGDYLRMIENQPYERSFNKRRFKSIAIQNELLSFSDNQIYCETNHMFIKTFFDVILRDFNHANIQVITLRRNLAQTLKSCIELDFFSPGRKSWTLWFSSPNAVTSAIPCIDSDENLDQYDLCIAYLIDIEARGNRFRQDYPHIKNYQVRLENFQDYDYIESLFTKLTITPTKATQEIYCQKINSKNQKKERRQKKVDIVYCQERINQYIDKAKRMGIILPPNFSNSDENNPLI